VVLSSRCRRIFFQKTEKLKVCLIKVSLSLYSTYCAIGRLITTSTSTMTIPRARKEGSGKEDSGTTVRL
jgi:hypothetical protein